MGKFPPMEQSIKSLFVVLKKKKKGESRWRQKSPQTARRFAAGDRLLLRALKKDGLKSCGEICYLNQISSSNCCCGTGILRTSGYNICTVKTET
jgi:hypothetical protein